MIYCIECGQEMPDNSKFCPSCGTLVVATKKSKRESTLVKPEPTNLGATFLNVKQTYGIINLKKLPEGHIIDKRYKVIKKLGQGSFGAVYKVYDKELEIEKALKIIPEAISNDKEVMKSLRKEASIMAKLNHASIVRVYDFHYSGDIKYIDMEYVEGESLADIKTEKLDKKFTEEEVKQYAIQILEGLNYAHKKSVIHKDIKPQNIMLDKSGKIRIMDFGIAESVQGSMSRLENTGSSGTLVYMSPEQIRGKDVGKESDIYSLGATLYELLNGNPPFYKGDITFQIINEMPEEIKGISEQMNIILQKCLKKDINERYSDCEEFLNELTYKIVIKSKVEEKQIEETPIIKEIKPEQINIQTQTKPQKKKKNYIALFVSLVLIFSIVMVSIYFKNKEQQKSKQQFTVNKIKKNKIVQFITNSLIENDKEVLEFANSDYNKVFTVKELTYWDFNNDNIKEVIISGWSAFAGTGGIDVLKVLNIENINNIKEIVIRGPNDIKYYNNQRGKLSFNVDADTLIFDYPIYKDSDANCCATGGRREFHYVIIENIFICTSIKEFNTKGNLTKQINLKEKSDSPKIGNVDIEMIFVKGGTFKMGSTYGDSDEKPIHTVTVDDFYIGKYEVTQKQWKEIMGNKPSRFKGDNLPVESVSWNNIQNFIKKLNQKTGKHYRLPTEAEWEYAARGGVETIHESSQTKYAGSNNIGNVAWYWYNARKKTHPVGTKQANELGIYDMSGNVWEWCSDWYGSYSRGSQNNPQGASSGTGRVHRGGSWYGNADLCGIANRFRDFPTGSYDNLGFRLAHPFP